MKRASRIVAIVVVIAACVGLGAYLVMNRQPPPAPPPKPQVKAPVKEMRKVKFYQVAVESNEPKLRPTEKDVEAGKNPAEDSLLGLIEQGDASGLANPIPKGTRLLGFKVRKGLATVNLSREFRDNFAGGSEAEGLTIGAILRTLAQFPEIKRVQFLVEGKPLDTLGHLDLSGPQDVRWAGSQFGGNN